MKRAAMLWTGVLAGPAVWFLNLEANFALAPLACGAQSKAPLHLVSIASLAIAAIAGILAASQWRQLSDHYGGGSPVTEMRLRGMAIAGITLSVLSFLVILAQSVPNVILAGCE